ncbi:MAG: Gldg family protein, partial [Deltaproteobacteria bacterium]|nr:Gldg family protein [Deltaproteobacteria bacterium]
MRKSLTYTFHAGLLVIIFAAIVVIIYLIALNHNTLWDLTMARENTLDPKTASIIDSLDFDVEIKVFEKEGQEQKNARSLLELYVLQSKHMTFEIIDPDVKPGLAEQCGVERYGQAVIYGKGRKERIEHITEESITSALLKLLRDKKKVVYFVTGHGENGLDDDQKQGISGLRDALEANNYMVKSCFLVREPSVPADADLVILAGPRNALFSEEQEMLGTYLEQGGRMFVALEPEHDAGMRDFLEKWGIEIDTDIIIDTFSRLLGGDYTCPVVNLYGDVKGLQGFGYTTFYPTARSLKVVDDIPIGLNIEWLVRTSDQSWSEHDLEKFFELGEA